MTQTEIEKDKKWVEDEIERDDDVEAEQIRLEVGESVKGLLLEKFDFEGKFGKRNWGYIIKKKIQEQPVLLFGCDDLNKKMINKQVNTDVCIERMPNEETNKGFTCHVYKTYHTEQ